MDGTPTEPGSPRLDALVPRLAAEFPAYDFATQRTWNGTSLVALRHDRTAASGVYAVITSDPREMRKALRPGSLDPRQRLRTREPAVVMVGRVLTVHSPYAWALVAGVKTTEERAWTTRYRGKVFIHAGKETDPGAPAGLWPDGQLVTGAVLGWVTLTRIDGEPGRYLWCVTGPVMLPEPVTGIRGTRGLWYWHLPSELQ